MWRVQSYLGVEMKESLREFAAENGLITLQGEEIKPGDFYIAERNTGPKLLECKEVDYRNWIVATELAYSYDTWECVKVEIVP